MKDWIFNPDFIYQDGEPWLAHIQHLQSIGYHVAHSGVGLNERRDGIMYFIQIDEARFKLQSDR